MKQVFVSGKGEVDVFEVPVPGRMRDSILVRNVFSAISPGTEGASVSRSSGLPAIYERARSSKDAVDKVWKLVETTGYLNTWETVRNKLDDWKLLGYSSAGIVTEVDGDRLPFATNDPVACMGAGLANHAEYVTIPKNLAAKIPPGVTFEEASFAALGCIALQGVRRLELEPGGRVGVLGLGLIGQLSARIAAALGYEVIGIDLSAARAAKAGAVDDVIAWDLGSTDSVGAVRDLTDGHGLDGVIVSAASTSDEPINLAFDLCRKRGRVSLVGDVGLCLHREKMYEKEIELRMSCSYGPGRYDASYELKGLDYPFAYVRWTEGRNLELFLRLLADRKLDISDLVSARFPVERAADAYSAVKSADADTYGILFDYGVPTETTFSRVERQTVTPVRVASIPRKDVVRIGLIGVGGHAKEVMIPALRKQKKLFSIRGLAGRSGASAGVEAQKLGAALATSDYRQLLDRSDIDAVLIATRHTTHARFVLEALDAGKHVYVEKPLCLTVEDGEAIVRKVAETGLVLRVGFNRRFSPYLIAMKRAVGTGRGPRAFSARVNTGRMPGDWSNTPEQGGRILGEAVHFLDLCCWFLEEEPERLSASFAGEEMMIDPTASIEIAYSDGSLGRVLYCSLGDPRLGKERFEAFGHGRSAASDDYRTFRSFGGSGSVGFFQRGKKGHAGALEEFGRAVQGKESEVAGADANAGLRAVRMALAAIESGRTGSPITSDL